VYVVFTDGVLISCPIAKKAVRFARRDWESLNCGLACGRRFEVGRQTPCGIASRLIISLISKMPTSSHWKWGTPIRKWCSGIIVS